MSRVYKEETPNTILAWNRETFGDRPNAVIGARTLFEVSEFYHAVMLGNKEEILNELADVGITFWLMAAANNVDARPSVPKESLLITEDLKIATGNLLKTFATYLDAIHGLQRKNSSAWLAKSMITLEIVTSLLDIDLARLVDAKMRINRARKWQRLPNGVDQHV